MRLIATLMSGSLPEREPLGKRKLGVSRIFFASLRNRGMALIGLRGGAGERMQGACLEMGRMAERSSRNCWPFAPESDKGRYVRYPRRPLIAFSLTFSPCRITQGESAMRRGESGWPRRAGTSRASGELVRALHGGRRPAPPTPRVGWPSRGGCDSPKNSSPIFERRPKTGVRPPRQKPILGPWQPLGATQGVRTPI